MAVEINKTGEIWQKRVGGAAVRLVGVVILIFALVMTTEHNWPWPAGGVLGAVGILLLIGRESVTVDRRAKTGITRWGLGVILYRKQTRFPRFDAVVIEAREKVSRGGSHPRTYIEYIIRLTGGDKAALIHRTTLRQETNLIAYDLAEYLEIPVTGDLTDPP